MSGLVGESKLDILSGFEPGTAPVATYGEIPASGDVDERTVGVLRFMKDNNLTFPLILKPDVGERGKGVRKVTSNEEIRAYIQEEPGRSIVQAYAPGYEFGVFYYRFPEEETGHIYSVTDKQFPRVVGNGKHTLQRLILDDERAVSMAKHYFKANHGRLFDVPEEGEEVKLIDIGTHSRGAVFLNGKQVLTPELERAFDQISKGFDGFYFGRFDIRTEDLEAFKAGTGFKIVELNGVTSEATHIYDPSNSLLSAYRTLMRQWEIAFEIGHQNRKRGIRPASVIEVLRRALINR